MNSKPKTPFAITITIASLCCGLALPSHAQTSSAPTADNWVSTWTAPPDQKGPALKVQTLRQAVRTSVGGSKLRLRFSNLFGTHPVTLGHVVVATQAEGSSTVAGSERPVTFQGSKTVTLVAGQSLLSDAITMDVAARQALTVSLFLPKGSSSSTVHGVAMQTVYFNKTGDTTTATHFPTKDKDDSRYFLTDVEVASQEEPRLIVALGDSITDGVGSTLEKDTRWTDNLIARLQADPALASIGVVNAGIAGNRILHAASSPFIGPSALARMERDVLSKPGVRWVILFEGINDITAAGMLKKREDQVSAQDITQGMQTLIAQAHAKRLKIFAATLLPRGGSTGPMRELPASAAMRQAVNSWIRTSGAFDAVIDFDKVVDDPARPGTLRAELDSGDKTHPNDAGYRAMAAAIDLGLFASQK